MLRKAYAAQKKLAPTSGPGLLSFPSLAVEPSHGAAASSEYVLADALDHGSLSFVVFGKSFGEKKSGVRSPNPNSVTNARAEDLL